MTPRGCPLVVLCGCALLLAVAGCGEASSGDPGVPFPDASIVLISLDTCRGDVLGLYGGSPGISPTLDAFAMQAVVFEHARAQAPHTAPSHMSVFTSLYPSVHGVQNVQHGEDAKGRSVPLIEALPREIPTLAEVLSGAGYATVGLTDGGNVNPAHGFDRGFDRYTNDLGGVAVQVDAGLTALHELVAAERPYFLFWHTYEIHAPYVSPRRYLDNWAPAAFQGPLRERVESLEGLGFRERFASMRSVFWRDKESFGWPESAYLHGLYRAGVKYTDDELARLLGGMADLGVLDDAIVVVMADHGEEFFEHGQWQHDQLYEETLRVPLMIRLPGGIGGGTRITTPVALIDIMPTLLELVGVERERAGAVPLPMQGTSLVEALLLGREPEPRPIYSEVRSDRVGSPLFDWLLAIHLNGMKFIYDEHRSNASKGVERRMLFDLAEDPGESTDLSGRGGSILDTFSQLRERHHRELALFADLTSAGGQGELSCDDLRQLVELGYVEATVLDGCDD